MSTAPEGAGVRPPLDIRKYPNRRYYDTTHSRHLTLEEIRALVREGHDVTVRDSKTGADLTAQVLTQIILELDTPKLGTFPVPLLLQVIRVNDGWVRDFVETYFNQAFKSFVEYQREFEDRMRNMRGMGGAFPPFVPWGNPMFGAVFGAPAGAEPNSRPSEPAGGGKTPSAPSVPAAADMRREVDELRRQVAAMEKQMAGGRSARRRGRKPAA